MKFKIFILILAFLVTILSGCESNNQVLEHQKEVSQLKEEINLLKKQNDEQKIKFDQINNEIQYKTEAIKYNENQISELLAYKQKVGRLTDINFEYEVVAIGTKKERNEKIVFLKNLPNDYSDKETFLIRAAIEFSNDRSKIISFWTDRNKAKQYASGNYNDEEGIFGWSGLDFRIGLIDNSKEIPILKFYLSSDDVSAIIFGKFSGSVN
jgi:hypothetical protein